MAYWLLKSEPDTFSLDDLERLGTSPWDGVRNYQARNYLKQMKPGDEGLFYHSRVEPPAIVGTCRIVSEPRPDPTSWDPRSPYFDPKSTPEAPRWWLVEVAFQERFPHAIPLHVLRTCPDLAGMMVARKGNRLSITPVTTKEWQAILPRGRGHSE